MAKTATRHDLPPDVATAFEACPAPAADHAMQLRDLVLETADTISDVGLITETLKWGQPAYLTQRPKSGTTIRLGWDETGTRVSLFVHCQTSLVGEWRQRYGDDLTFVGNREIAIPTNQTLPREPLRHCIAMALSYHSRKTTT